MAFGLPDDLPPPEIMRLIKEKLNSLQTMPPIVVEDAPVLENIQEWGNIDLLKFSVPRWHEYDGERYIGTSGMVLTRDPKDGWVNMGN